jgi:hypothetical protein
VGRSISAWKRSEPIEFTEKRLLYLLETDILGNGGVRRRGARVLVEYVTKGCDRLHGLSGGNSLTTKDQLPTIPVRLYQFILARLFL